MQHLLEITGDWQKFKGLPGTEGTLRVAEPKPSKQALFEAALAAAGEEPTTEATTPKQRKSAPKKADADKDRDRRSHSGLRTARSELGYPGFHGVRGEGVSVLSDALEHLVRGIVDHPDDVRVNLLTTRRGRTLEVHVHPEDLGKVIGRGGRTATALRTVMAGIGGRGLRVDVVDTDR